MTSTLFSADSMLIDHGRPLIFQKLAPGLAANLAVGATFERGASLTNDAAGATAVTISLAERLHAAPKDVESLLTRPVGSRFQAGEEIGRGRKGLRGQSVTAPFDGILRTYNASTGIALFMSGPSVSASALVTGKIERISGDSIAIRAAGSRLSGIVGFGRDGAGPVRFISSDSSHLIAPQEITEAVRGAVVIAGPWVSAAAYKRFAEVGVVAVITGSLVEPEVTSAFGPGTGDRLQNWRDPAGAFKPTFAVIATEGFGQMPMHAVLWSFLKEREGQEAIVLVTSELENGRSRPELIFEDGVIARPAGGLKAGSKLRLVDQSSLGVAAVANHMPERGRFVDGRAVETVDVVLANKAIATVSMPNVEFIV